MPGYINILQGKIARYEQGITPEGCLGFFTDEMTSCSLLVFSGKKNNKRRISAFHSDGHLLNVNPEMILAEIAWVGNVESCFLYRDPNFDCDKPHPLINFARENNLKIFEKNLDVEQCDETEVAITFDESYKKGYRFKGYAHNTFHKQIINHPDAVRMYAFYTLNINLLEIQSNAAFNQLCNDDPGLLNQWESYKISFTKRRKLTCDSSSVLGYNPIMFDGQHFTNPGLHDLSLTPFATQFSNQISERILNTESLYHAELLSDMSKEQLVVINLMYSRSDFDRLGKNNPKHNEAISKSEIIAGLNGFIKSNFDINRIPSTFLKILFIRYQQTCSLFETNTNTNQRLG